MQSAQPRDLDSTIGWPSWRRRLLSLSVLLLAACGAVPTDSEPGQNPPPDVWLVSLGHSQSDEAEEQAHLTDFERLLLPEAMARGATVFAYTVGADGYTSPRRLSEVSFDTSAVDGNNPVKRDRLRDERRDQLMGEISSNAQQIEFSPTSDAFGGFAAAQSFFDQFPPETPKTLVAIGDQLANRPTGCVLASRDLSSPATRAALLAICAPAVPDFSNVRVMLVGAGFSLDDTIPSPVAFGLERLLHDYFSAANASVALYRPVLVAPGTGAEVPR